MGSITIGAAPNGIDTDPNPPQPVSSLPSYSLSTQAIHADDHLNQAPDVAPPIHVATTFRYADHPDNLIPARDTQSSSFDSHVYSRHTAPSTTRLEALLSSLIHAPTLTYSSGLAALHAVYVYLHPKRVSIGEGYHGSHGVLEIHKKLSGTHILPLDCPAEELGPGDVIHLETPLNPTGEAYEIAQFAEKAHSRGAFLLVDSTFGPPGLQDPFLWGADVVMHSGTKYIGGHSDLLCGVLATRREEWVKGMGAERVFLGSVMGSLEGWLGVRSLRTLEVRVERQSENAGRLVGWLNGLLSGKEEGNEVESDSESREVVRGVVERIQHASLQKDDMGWLRKQMPNGFGPVFALWMKSEDLARRLPSKLELFHHATSLGGVESLIEWRTMSDPTVDTRVMRVSVGVESWEDLRDDFLKGFRELYREQGSK
ncbi:hypothetical protein MMC24_006248 [Lignoscripta atroalba]|nr:hypothetical protein [Lignoscripta atroalba]